uniref:carnitine O-palmitoyltransferase n=1 Tax=Trichuris muris TaxID=70415 RepID=A0A5S6QB24_TRIMR
MAEAHNAVAFGFTITHDGVSINYDQELLKVVFRTLLRNYKRRVARFKNNFRTGIYPASPQSLLFTLLLVYGCRFASFDLSFGLIGWLQSCLLGYSIVSTLFCVSLYSVVLWLLVVQALRLFIKLLFCYKQWMYHRVHNTSITTKLYMFLLRSILKHEPMLNSFQGALPRLPLPSLKGTLRRHLQSLEPLLEREQYERMSRLSDEFQRTIGPKLQRYLLLKSWFSTNYVSDWWEEYVYLRGRSPLMINSNYYGLDALGYDCTKVQAARAANMTYASLIFRRLIERQELKPIMIGCVPLCSAQYERAFNTCRIPGVVCDTLKHWNDSKHIAVYVRGCWFKVMIHNGNRLLKPCELENIFEGLLQQEHETTDAERYLASLTAWERSRWAEFRQERFSNGVNKVSLHAIESSAFVLILDDEDFVHDESDGRLLDRWAHSALHGKAYDRWFDKSFNLVIGRNGKCALNAEHAWADAPIISHYFEFVMIYDFIKLGYTADGHCVGEVEVKPPAPQRLKWDLPYECCSVIRNCVAEARKLMSDVEMALMVYKEFGKGFMKKCGTSPDGFIQMALQLTYYRDQKKFCLTYEACMTRLYREGRTETVRPVTKESCAFVRAMDDPDVQNSQRRLLLQKACERHQKGYLDAMCSKGVDRHLFCLYVISRYLELDSPFLKEVLSEPWRLSTSQTPQQQTNLVDTNKYPEFVSMGGGFGPVADDGYGVSYIIAGDQVVSYHISAKVSCPTTSAPRFRDGLRRALSDIRALFEQ